MRYVPDKYKKALIADMKPNIWLTLNGRDLKIYLNLKRNGPRTIPLITTMALEKLSTPLILLRVYIGRFVKSPRPKALSHLKKH